MPYYIQTEDDAVRSDPVGVPNWFFWLFAGSLVARQGLGADVLNLFLPYTTGGSGGLGLITKIHPGSYGLILAGLLSLPMIRRMSGPALTIAAPALILMVLSVAVFTISRGNTSNIGYLFDTLFAAPLAIYAAAYLSPHQRLKAIECMLALYVFNSVLVVVELALGRHLIPSSADARLAVSRLFDADLVFRPSGLFGHPLTVGTSCSVALAAVFTLPVRPIARWGLSVLLLATIIVVQSRLATLLGGCIFVFGSARALRHDLQHGRGAPVPLFVVLVLGIAALPLALALAYNLGFLDRLSSGFSDSSTFARINVYVIFKYFSWDELLWGGVSFERVTYMALEGLGLPFIESPIVAYVSQVGIVGTAMLVPMLAVFLLSLIARAPWFLKFCGLAFCMMLFSNNALAVKGSNFIIGSVMLFCCATLSRTATVRMSHHGSALRTA